MKWNNCISWVFALGLLVGCPNMEQPATEEEQLQAYRLAVADAEVADANEISTNLTAITGYNSDLIWEGEQGVSRVKMVTFTDWTGYSDMVGQSYNTTRNIWVTAVPEIQDFFETNSIACDARDLRLKMLLGLPPDGMQNMFVEFWVWPADLFRPTPDPEVTDHEAELDFPSVLGGYLTIGQDYIDWFNQLLATMYGENGYPWTRLGYTYDWGNPNSEVGLSEFIIRVGATIYVSSVTSTENYCECSG